LKEAHVLGLSEQTPYNCITPAVDLNFIQRHAFHNVDKNDVLQLVTIARLHYIKGIDPLIETAFLLKQQHLKFCWHIIGSGTKNYLERYGYHIYEKGLTDEVILTGQLTHAETISLLNSADLYIQPSLNEGFCNAVLEAQTLEKLCVAADVGGLTENIVDQETGWLVPKNDPAALAKQIKEVHQLSTFDKDTISKNAMLRVKNQFNIEKQKQEFLKFYTSPI
jgi:colanic acid/amylovoran biosynthesis glycosyltransferase